jgi:hypothetical protein
VCHLVIGAGVEVTRQQTGRQIQVTCEVLDTWPQSDAWWLGAAQDALTSRHSVQISRGSPRLICLHLFVSRTKLRGA